jgi:hypothetical protein
MAAQPGISTTSAPPNTVVAIQPGMSVQPVVLVDQYGDYVTASTASALATTTAPVNVGNATAPTSGEVLTAVSGTAATWQAAGGVPSGSAGGDLGGTYPNPTVTATHLASPQSLAQGGTAQNAASNAALLTALGAAALAGAAFAGEVTVQTPVNPSDAVTKAYADAIAQGLSVKPSVQEATAAALPANTYSNGASGVGATLTAVLAGVLTVDGIAVALGDRVLVQNEAAPANNGIYTVTTLGTVGVAYILTRAVGMNIAASVPGAFAFTEQGTANTAAGFTVASEGPFTIGTTAITWTQFSGAGEITAGTGLSKSGNTLSLITPVAAGNLPTGTTSAKGALQLDGTAGDIAALGTQAAGAVGKPADAGHVHPVTGLMLADYTQPSGATAATLPRWIVSVPESTLVSGTLYVCALSIAAGIAVNNITFMTGAAPVKAGGTHGWYVLLDSGLVVRAVTADQTDASTVWGVQKTFYTLATNSYTATYTGLYYVGVMVAESAGTMPTFAGAAGFIGNGANTPPPIFCGTSSTGQTTPPAAGTTMTAIAGAVNYLFYAYTS